LGLDVEQKNLEEIKKAIKDEIEKNKQNKQKIDKDLPGLLDKDGKVDDNKLKEIEDNYGKGAKYQKLVDEPKNNQIKSADGKDIDQVELDKILKNNTDYNNLVKDNPDLVTDGEIDPAKVKDLSEKGQKFKDLEDTMKEAGIDPSNAAEAKKEIGELNALKVRVMELFGKDYKERLEVQEYQAAIEVKTINN